MIKLPLGIILILLSMIGGTDISIHHVTTIQEATLTIRDLVILLTGTSLTVLGLDDKLRN